MKIVILAGGLSPERDVSLTSGSLIANALREAGHHVLLLDVYEGIPSFDSSNIEYLFEDAGGTPYSYSVPDVEPDLDEIKKRNNNGDSLIGPHVLEICKHADIVFLALHGAMGENGQIQAVFDVMGIRYTGTGYIGSLLAMDKDISKKMMQQAGVPTAEWSVFTGDSLDPQNVINRVGLPCVVKPCSCGSSIGISMADTYEELKAAIAAAKKIEPMVLVEKRISGREFSVGVLGGRALPVIEIIPDEGFYDYRNKYQKGRTKEICPAQLSDAETGRVQALALKVHEVLRLGTYSRIDFILNEENGEFVCLEANTLPGMTPTSLIPQEALADGISYMELCNLIVQLSLNKCR